MAEEKKKTTKNTPKKTTKKATASKSATTKKTSTTKKVSTAKKANTKKSNTAKKVAPKKTISKETKKAIPKKTTIKETKKVAPKKTNTKSTKPKKEVVKEIIPTKEELKYSDEDIKIYKILSYIGFLWIIGLLVPYKNDKSLKFHVGQGIILSIFEFVLSISVSLINNLIIDNIFKIQVSFYGIETGVYKTSALGLTISGLLNLAVAVFTISYVIIGIANVTKEKDKKLPVIGNLSFYK